jgi:hypothetical protein
MRADGIPLADPGKRNQHQCGNDDGGTAEPADCIAPGRRLDAPIAPGVTILVDESLLLEEGTPGRAAPFRVILTPI